MKKMTQNVNASIVGVLLLHGSSPES